MEENLKLLEHPEIFRNSLSYLHKITVFKVSSPEEDPRHSC